MASEQTTPSGPAAAAEAENKAETQQDVEMEEPKEVETTAEDSEMKEATQEETKEEDKATDDKEEPEAGKKAEQEKQDKTAESDVASQEEEAAKEGSKDSADKEVSSPKRKEETEAAADGAAATDSAAEPAAKKQKVDAANGQAAEKPADEAASAIPSVMISRDDMAKMEEDSGKLKFDVITNDGTPEHMIQLTTLKNIFAKQLPKMPKEYIVRLVFDRNHKSMLLLKNGTHVIGGICYRPFEANHFAEIAFCAINASDQVKGYGTRLMNHLKEYVKTKNITHFLTYADNYAIGYFKKQGFTKIVSMPRPNWYGYIKDYDGGTLMECTIHTQINYLRITSMIHMQRKAIQDKIKERSKDKTVYPGLTKFADGRLMDIYMVPGVKEAGWSQAVIRNNRIGTRDQGSLKSQLSQLLKAITSHRSAWPFHEPVDTSVVVDYLDHIKEPVDLQLIGKRIESGSYINKAAFKADLDKMCDNCTTYNTPDTNYYKAAVDLRQFIQTRVQIRDHK